ncbi:MFS transporter [Amycolatopsis sp.]|uniref:MFS transporter n=1 Tax=Amycolatopsis sp. TaxID=37632 RepID=UPI002CC7029F|nr:MFS transporter [Amycolatopsis sp.]HVV12816.1 MFS transporter [Amycolatopsis sp.]
MTTGVVAEPDSPVGGGWIARISLAVLGFWVVVLAPVQVLLPVQVERIDPAHKESSLALVTAAAAIVSVLAAPVAGAFSDRTRARLGRRQPWILGGALVCAVVLCVQAMQGSVLGVALCWMIAQGAQNAMFAGLTASVPDQVPVRQRGVVSGFVGLTGPLGLVLGVLLVTQVVPGQTAGYVTLAALLLVLTLPFLTTTDTRITEREPLRWRRFFAGFWISPRKYPDFAWAAVSRLAIQLANAIATLYLLYFLRDAVHLAEPADGVFVLTIVYTVGILITSVLSGRLSDRSGRRKPFVVTSSVVIAVAMLILAIWPSWPAAMAAAAVLGLGFGVYAAIDAALITQVLPKATDRGKDLGVLNVANTASQALAPLIAGGLISLLHSYTVLYIVAAVIALAGAALVLPIRSVR